MDRNQPSSSWRDRADAPEMALAVTKMLMAFRDKPSDPTELTETYCEDLGLLDLALIERVCRRFRHGEVRGHDAAFAPSLAEMWTEIRSLEADDREHERLMRSPLRPPPPGPNKAERERIGKALDEYAADLRRETVDTEAAKRSAMWASLGPALWRRFGHDLDKPWTASPELETLIREQGNVVSGSS